MHEAECFPGNSYLPFSSDFGDLQAKVHRVEIRGLPLEDFITPPRFVPLQGKGENYIIQGDEVFYEYKHDASIRARLTTL